MQEFQRSARWAVGLVMLVFAGRASADWIVEEVPSPPEWTAETLVNDVNEASVVCGAGNYGSGSYVVAFRYDGTVLEELPYLDDNVSYRFGLANAISDTGLIAGWSHNADEVDRAVIWDGTGVNEIPLPADGKPTSDMRAYGINDDGIAVGYYVNNVTDYPTAFYFDGTNTHSLRTALINVGLTGERSYAKDVNNNGLICGHAEDATSEYLFFTYDINTGTVTILGGMSPYGMTSYFVTSINDAGHVIGRGRTLPWDPTIHALLHDGEFHVIDDGVSVAQWTTDIAENGRVVGYADTSDDKWSWYADGVGTGAMVPIELPGWSEISVRGVNDSGQMAGSGASAAAGGAITGFILSPPEGDGDRDGDVDADDLAMFAGCVSGPVEGSGFSAPGDACLIAFDFAPADGDVDAADYGRMQEAVAAAQP